MTEPSDDPHTRPRLPLEILLAAVVVLVAGWLFKSHCYLDGGWDAGEQYTVGCYTDVIPFWDARGVAAGAVPYLETPLEYPVLTGAQIWVEGAFSRMLVGPDGGALVFLGVVTLVNAALALGVLVVLHRMGVPRQRLWWWALAPAIVLYVGHNWDLLAMFLTVLAIDLHRRGRAAGAGVALGLGTAAKLFPGLLLPLLLLTHLRRREVSQLVATAGAAAITWMAVNLPVGLAAPQRWAEFYTFSQERFGTFAATWTVIQDLGLLTTSVEERNLFGSLAFALGAAAIVWAGWGRYRGQEWVLITPILAWFLLTNKVWSPQFDLWLIPLLVLTARRMWPVAAFAVTDIGVYWLEFWWLARRAAFTPSASYEALAVAAGLRAAVLIGIIVLAVRDGPPTWLAPKSEEVPAAMAPVGADSR
ncbi:MAG TPA: glycosyltransferase 87 family protein [Euzebyales bacterium]|nr:glycosyltransferase 87 family protein [Euzebyales bacterium]